jgi:N-acetylglucosaminyldiphosphoundecaprenol N-acetyl-beta-D-mannosaminyltransferase
MPTDATPAPVSTAALPARANVLGVQISITDYAEVTRVVLDAARAGRSLALAAVDVHSVIQAQDDAAYAAVLNSFELATPDGQPVRWAMQLTGQAQLDERVYGPTLMLHVCESAAAAGLGVFLYGARDATLQALRTRLCQRFPTLQIAGQRAGRFRPLTSREQAEDAREITNSGASIVFVGMGCPRQEWWVFRMRERIGLPLLAVGAAFDIHAGLVRQAPSWMQARGLEWLFRLAREPRRLGRRYLVRTPRYLPLLATQVLGLREFPAPRDLSRAVHHECPG